MVVNVTLAATQASVGVVPAFPAYVGNVDQVTAANAKTSGREQSPVAGSYMKYTHEYVDASGTVKSVGDAAQNFVRYAEYPGQRLFRKVKFSVNNNPLNSYVSTLQPC